MKSLEDMLFDFTDQDYICTAGDPVAIALATLIAARRTGGKLNIIKWQRLTADYVVYPICVPGV